MRWIATCLCAALLLVAAGCIPAPTEREIADSLDASLQSVAGEWTGTSSGRHAIVLEFSLREDGDGRVSGAGRMHDARSGVVSPFSVAGSYRRPALALSLQGLQYTGEPMQAALEGKYVTVGGIAATLHLTDSNNSREVPILLQESP